MLRKFFIVFIATLVLTLIIGYLLISNTPWGSNIKKAGKEKVEDIVAYVNPLSIAALKNTKFEGTDLVIEENLSNGVNYKQYIASYKSEGLKIYALLTVSTAKKPTNGYPVIIFNHGYIPPKEYTTTERYVNYVDYFARNGYVVIKPDYRGHGKSDGDAVGGYGSNAYTIDVINALESVKKYQDVDPNRIGMWGHSMGGFLTLRSMVVRKDIKAGVIWGGVVAPYKDLLLNWRKNIPPPQIENQSRKWRTILYDQFGGPEENPDFWDSISSNSYLSDISGPIQLHHAKGDETVPYSFSETLADEMKSKGKEVELYLYEGDNHNISDNFGIAMKRSLDFFDKYLKD